MRGMRTISGAKTNSNTGMLVSPKTVGANILSLHPMAYWKMQDNDNRTMKEYRGDVSKFGAYENVTTSSKKFLDGTYVKFWNGGTSCARISNMFIDGNMGTIAGWLDAAYGTIFSAIQDPNNAISINVDNGNVAYKIISGGQEMSISAPKKVGWNHLAMSWTKNGFSAYINGHIVGHHDDKKKWSAGGGPLKWFAFGALNEKCVSCCLGHITNFALWQNVLSDSDILMLSR